MGKEGGRVGGMEEEREGWRWRRRRRRRRWERKVGEGGMEGKEVRESKMSS